MLRWGGMASILAIALIFGGFLRFADSVTTLKPPLDPRADAIVVLTGGYQRIDQAVELLQKGAGKRLLISGVHPTTTPKQIRRMTQASPELFTCCVDVGYDALDTIGNAQEASNWIHQRGYKSVLVVTNNYHMPRSLAELALAMPRVTLLPFAVTPRRFPEEAWWLHTATTRVLLSEYLKYLPAIGRLTAQRVMNWGDGPSVAVAAPKRVDG